MKRTTALISMWKEENKTGEALTFEKCKGGYFNTALTVYGAGKRLPAEYQEVEYIESTGTQWIDTGVNPDFTTNTIITFQKNELSTGTTNQFFSGASGYINGAGVRYYVLLHSDTTFLSNNKNNTAVFTTAADLDIHTINYNDENHNIIYDGRIVGTLYSWDGEIPNPISLFGRYDGAIQERSKFKLYKAKIIKSNIKIRDYVPCYRKADNVAGLYDLVNNEFYTNAGTGTFLVGSGINCVKQGTEIGVNRNFCLKTNQGTTGWAWNLGNGSYTKEEVIEDGIRCCKMTRTAATIDSWAVLGYPYSATTSVQAFKYQVGKTYSVSFEAKTCYDNKYSVQICDGSTQNQISGWYSFNLKANEWTKCTFSFVCKEVTRLKEQQLYIAEQSAMREVVGNWHIFRNLKIEEGQSTEWTPAPEDENNKNLIKVPFDLYEGDWWKPIVGQAYVNGEYVQTEPQKLYALVGTTQVSTTGVAASISGSALVKGE